MVAIVEWLLRATPLFHHQLYFMIRYCVQNFKILCSIIRKLRWCLIFNAMKSGKFNIPQTIIPKYSMHINEMSKCIKFQYYSFLNLSQMYLKITFFNFDKLIQYVYILCPIYVNACFYGIVAYSNPIIPS